MKHQKIRDKFKEYFKSKGHTWVPSSSLIPDDPSVLFTTAGMQQFKKYYTDPESAPAKNVASIQKCLRTSDIDEVGDESHLTFFEMMGNFSFGFVEGSRAEPGIAVGYGKKEAIEYAYEFITKEMGLEIDYVSVFGGEGEISADEESEKVWKSINPNIEVKRLGRKDNFWGPTGNEGPCGPTTEIFVKGSKAEVWNIVFNEYYCNSDKSFKKLERLGVDTGMGLERLVAVVQKKSNIFETDLFESIINLITSELDLRIRRIIADHSRSISFLIADGVQPSNKEQGYVLRRLMRRIITYFYISKTDATIMHDVFAKISEIYNPTYPDLDANLVIHEFDMEKERFEKTLVQGMKELEKTPLIGDQEAFKLYESFGLPYEVIKELAGEKAKNLTRKSFDQEYKKHQEKSRAGVEKKFWK